MRRLGLLIPILVLSLCGGCGFGDRADILLLVRAGDPVSRAIADAYAAQRDIDAERIFELTLTGETDAVEIDAESYLREIAAPLESHLALIDPDGDVTLLVTTQGLPLRIGHCDVHAPRYPADCESAAVDAALAQLGRTGNASRAFLRTENPFFRDPRSFETFRREVPDAALRFLVARLAGGRSSETEDGVPKALHALIHRPAPEPARDTPDESAPPLWQVLAEHAPDARPPAASVLLDPIRQQLPRFGQRVCDACPEAAAQEPSAGVIVQARTDPVSLPAQLGYPGLVIRIDETAIDGARVSPSASRFDRFLTRWLARGAGAISTHVGNPSLADVTRPTAQLIALAEGSAAVEAHFKSVPQLGWMNVFIGDPLLSLPGAGRLAEGEPDHDRDGVPDAQDNCRDDPNPNQLDTNADGLGNLCDPDVDNDGDVDTSWGAIYPIDERGDLQAIMLTARNGPFDPNHDLNGDGRVDERDLVRAQLWLFRSPGRPSQEPVAAPVADE